MPINDIDPLLPAAGDNVSDGDNEIRDLKQDIRDSFPGLTSNSTDAVVTDAGSGGSPTGPEIAYAANTFTSGLKSTYDTAVTATGTNATNIASNISRLNALEKVGRVYSGRVDFSVPSIAGGTAVSAWTATKQATGIMRITHNLGAAVTVTATPLYSGAGSRGFAMINSTTANYFDVFIGGTSGGFTDANADFHFFCQVDDTG